MGFFRDDPEVWRCRWYSPLFPQSMGSSIRDPLSIDTRKEGTKWILGCCMKFDWRNGELLILLFDSFPRDLLSCLLPYLLTYLLACLLTYVLTCLLTYVLTYLLTCLLIATFLPSLLTYLLTYLFAYLLA